MSFAASEPFALRLLRPGAPVTPWIPRLLPRKQTVRERWEEWGELRRPRFPRKEENSIGVLHWLEQTFKEFHGVFFNHFLNGGVLILMGFRAVRYILLLRCQG